MSSSLRKRRVRLIRRRSITLTQVANASRPQTETRSSRSQGCLDEGLERWGDGSSDEKEHVRQNFNVAEFILIPLFNHLVTEAVTQRFHYIFLLSGGGGQHEVLGCCPQMGDLSVLRGILPEDAGVKGNSSMNKTFLAVLAESVKNWKTFK